jgi:uncharacterized tellurite resistance protein B-like protein
VVKTPVKRFTVYWIPTFKIGGGKNQFMECTTCESAFLYEPEYRDRIVQKSKIYVVTAAIANVIYADGKVEDTELKTAYELVCKRFDVRSESDQAVVLALLMNAIDSLAPRRSVEEDLASTFCDAREAEEIVDVLFEISAADGEMAQSETAVIKDFAKALKVDEARQKALYRKHRQRLGSDKGGHEARHSEELTDALGLLDLTKSCTSRTAKDKYHSLIHANHPDKLPDTMAPEFKELANKKSSEIMEAYRIVKKWLASKGPAPQRPSTPKSEPRRTSSPPSTSSGSSTKRKPRSAASNTERQGRAKAARKLPDLPMLAAEMKKLQRALPRNVEKILAEIKERQVGSTNLLVSELAERLATASKGRSGSASAKGVCTVLNQALSDVAVKANLTIEDYRLALCYHGYHIDHLAKAIVIERRKVNDVKRELEQIRMLLQAGSSQITQKGSARWASDLNTLADEVKYERLRLLKLKNYLPEFKIKLQSERADDVNLDVEELFRRIAAGQNGVTSHNDFLSSVIANLATKLSLTPEEYRFALWYYGYHVDHLAKAVGQERRNVNDVKRELEKIKAMAMADA